MAFIFEKLDVYNNAVDLAEKISGMKNHFLKAVIICQIN
jgi:hypothetical protein